MWPLYNIYVMFPSLCGHRASAGVNLSVEVEGHLEGQRNLVSRSMIWIRRTIILRKGTTSLLIKYLATLQDYTA